MTGGALLGRLAANDQALRKPFKSNLGPLVLLVLRRK
jgi:hypothetical protein